MKNKICYFKIVYFFTNYNKLYMYKNIEKSVDKT